MRNELTAELARELLDYDPATGTLTWKYRPSAVRGWNVRNAGKVAGRRSGVAGYWQIGVYGTSHSAHRVIWLMMTGVWPEHEIDHRNNIPHDNRWDNLREATPTQNQQNSRTPKHSTIGLKGVSREPGCATFYTRIRAGGKRIRLGNFPTPEAAHAAYCRAAIELHGEFFNPGHSR